MSDPETDTLRAERDEARAEAAAWEEKYRENGLYAEVDALRVGRAHAEETARKAAARAAVAERGLAEAEYERDALKIDIEAALAKVAELAGRLKADAEETRARADKAEAALTESRATNARLNRRAQEAERAANERLELGGATVGRALANYAASMYRRALGEVAVAMGLAADTSPEAVVERVRAVALDANRWAAMHTCIVCKAELLMQERPPYCEDSCSPDEEHDAEWAELMAEPALAARAGEGATR